MSTCSILYCCCKLDFDKFRYFEKVSHFESSFGSIILLVRNFARENWISETYASGKLSQNKNCLKIISYVSRIKIESRIRQSNSNLGHNPNRMSNSNRDRFQIERICFVRIRTKILAQYFYAIIFAKLFQSFWFENAQSKLGFDEQNDRTICYSGIEKVSWYQLDLICYFHVWNWETLQFEVVWVEGLQNITIIGLY